VRLSLHIVEDCSNPWFPGEKIEGSLQLAHEWRSLKIEEEFELSINEFDEFSIQIAPPVRDTYLAGDRKNGQDPRAEPL